MYKICITIIIIVDAVAVAVAIKVVGHINLVADKNNQMRERHLETRQNYYFFLFYY